MTKDYWDIEVETQAREEIEATQLTDLKEIVQFAYDNSPYYKRYYDANQVNPKQIESLTDLQKFPFVDKATQRETQGVGSFLGELAAVDEKEVVFISASSGSTGKPTISPFTKLDFDDFQSVESRLFYQVGMRNTDRYAHALNFSLFVGGPDVIGAQILGALCIWIGTVPSERLIYILKEFQPTIIWTTPSYAWYLGETAKKQGIDPAKDLAINKIIVAGEPGGSIGATREAIEELWQAELFDFYGLSDIFGACAAMCEAKSGLHLAEDHILVETINPETLEVLPDGEIGELIFTTLRKKARPLIRFRTGDIGFVDRSRCECGRTLARINIVGRRDDMLIIGGVNVFPSDFEEVLRNIDDITGEFIVRVYEKNYMVKYALEIEKSDESDILETELVQKVSKRLKAKLGVKPDKIVVLKDGDLPRSTHKAKRIIDERQS